MVFQNMVDLEIVQKEDWKFWNNKNHKYKSTSDTELVYGSRLSTSRRSTSKISKTVPP